MTTRPASRLIPASLPWVTLLALRLDCLAGIAAEPAATLGSVARPFVLSNTLAGAVMLVDEDRVKP